MRLKSTLLGCNKFVEEANIVLGEHAQVFHLILEVGDTFYTHAESEAGIFFRVYAAGLKHIGIHHTAAQNLDPAGAFAERAALASAKVAAYIHLGRGFGEGEVAGA